MVKKKAAQHENDAGHESEEEDFWSTNDKAARKRRGVPATARPAKTPKLLGAIAKRTERDEAAKVASDDEEAAIRSCVRRQVRF